VVSIAVHFNEPALPLVVSNDLSLLIEEPLLSEFSSSIPSSLKQPLVSTVHLSNSVEWKLRDNVEWSIDKETEFFIESLGLNLGSLGKIQNFPLLMSSTVVSENTNFLSFFVFSSNDFKDLVVT
jgi:hypothetical protein